MSTFLKAEILPAASYGQHYLFNANLKPESTVLLSMARLIPRIRASFSSNSRFYMAPLSPSPHPPSHSHGGLLIISCPMSPCAFSNGFLLMSDRLLFILEDATQRHRVPEGNLLWPKRF